MSTGVLLPNFVTDLYCSALSSTPWYEMGMSPISSKNRVPFSAFSKHPCSL